MALRPECYRLVTLFSSLIQVTAFVLLLNAQSMAAPPLGLNPNFSSIPFKTEESVGEIIGITKDHKGFMWLAGSAGIARYDGYRFHLYSSEFNDLGQVYVNDVFEDSFQQLWIAASEGGVARLNRELDVFETFAFNDSDDGGRVEKIYEDDERNLWFVGGGGVARFDRDEEKLVRYLQESELKKELIADIVQIDGSEYLLATRNGVFLWNRSTENVEHFPASPSTPDDLPHSVVRALAKDLQGNIWVGHDQGLSLFHRDSKRFTSIAIDHAVKERKSVSIWRMITDASGLLWLGTDGNGLMYFNPQTHEFGSYVNSFLPSSLGTSVVRSIYEDELGDLWIGGYPAGLYHYNKSNNFFSIYSNFIRDKNDIHRNHTWAFAEDAKGNLWLGMDSLGVVYYDREKGTFSQRYNGFDLSNKGLPFSVLSLLLDSKGNLWIGSWAQGVSRLNTKTNEIVHFRPKTKGGDLFEAESVWHIMESKSGDIYFGTMERGLIRYNDSSQTFTRFFHDTDNLDSISDNSVWSIVEASDGRFWLGTFGGLNVLDPKTGVFRAFRYDPSDPKSISTDRTRFIFEDSKQRLWVSTLGGGVNIFDVGSETFTRLSEADGLLSENVQSVMEDDNGVMWVATTKGITSIDSKTSQLQNYTYKNWLQNGEFSHGAVKKLANGDIAFGGVNGFNILHPNQVTSNTYVPPVYLTELVVLNTPINATEHQLVVDRDIVEAEKIQLTHNDSMVSLTFSALNYRVYDDNQYKYKLEGYDDDWRIVPGSNKAIYTRLGAGKYTFIVKASNNNNVWSQEKVLTEIIVLPAPWRTWWAYSIYVCLVLLIVSRYVLSQKKKIRQANEVNNKLVELDKLKDDFIANISHELRTPLNGILGMAQSLGDDASQKLTESGRNSLSAIISCGYRLERLVNNILDYSKSKKGTPELSIAYGNVFSMFETILPECLVGKVHDGVNVMNTVDKDTPLIRCDINRTINIFFNIVENAIKFTEKGSVVISAHADEHFVHVSIQDTGGGIAEESMSKLYTSFTQLTESGIHTKNGTGLGLAVSKYFIEIQGGHLTLDTELGVGSTFIVSLPKADQQMIAEPLVGDETLYDGIGGRLQGGYHHQILRTQKDAADQLAELGASNEEKPLSRSNGTILVVDDELVNRMVISGMVAKHGFVVHEASTGVEALEVLDGGLVCDLILLDIMMPKLSGFDVCREIRKKYSPQELPIIFVSAKSQSGDIVECFNVHGNDFISKPVNKDELLARIKSQLESSTVYRALKKCS